MLPLLLCGRRSSNRHVRTATPSVNRESCASARALIGCEQHDHASDIIDCCELAQCHSSRRAWFESGILESRARHLGPRPARSHGVHATVRCYANDLVLQAFQETAGERRLSSGEVGVTGFANNPAVEETMTMLPLVLVAM
jgi:hypothetical protein